MSWIHWVMVLVVVVLVFGTGKLKNLGKDLGEGVKGFKDGIKDGNNPQVGEGAKTAEKKTIDVETREKV